MTRATETLTALTCDRCAKSVRVEGKDKTAEWGTLYAAQDGGAHQIGQPRHSGNVPADLCPDCLEEVVAWWRGGEVLRKGCADNPPLDANEK